MQNSSFTETRRGLLLTLFLLGLVTVLVLVPTQFRSEAISTGEGLFTRTSVHNDSIPNYDIRSSKGVEIDEYFSDARESVGKNASFVADIRDGFVRGEVALRERLPNVKFEYNEDIRTPEVITPDVFKARMEWLTPPSSMKRSQILRNFAKENNELVGVDDQQVDDLKVLSDYTNPDGNLSYVHLEQRIDGIPIFRSELKAGFTQDNRIIRVINNLAPGLDYESLSRDFGDPLKAVRAAARHLDYELPASDLNRNAKESSDLKLVFGNGDSATTAEKMYFPTEPGVAVPAWRVLIWQPVTAYYVIVDAHKGTMLWRKNIGNDQTSSATYNVYRNPNAYIPAHDSPAPLSPGPVDPTLGTQGAIIARSNTTLIGNEGSNSFNNLGWMTDGTNITDGNNVEAGIDRVAPDGVDAPQPGNGACPGVGCRVFDAPTWNPPPGSPAPGDDPLTAPAQRGAVIQMFYVMNLYHDELYKRGWTEPAFNFQNDNFGRGGAGADRVRAEGQDSSGTNNANMQTPADGGRGRMQMFVWTGPTPDYDGTADAEVIIHEITHGLSNRLHGNAGGLNTNMAGGMGEGWSDFYSYTLLAEPTDPINGIYTTGGYATYLIAAGFTGNYYYGIRRFPRAPLSFLGTNGRPHNPYTFRYVNAGCAALLDGSQSAFPRGPIGVAQCDQVHNLGEIWSSALWEVRNRMVTRLGFTAGTTRVLQVVTDGMKLAPIGPTFLQERDAIIAAASALPAAPEAALDANDVREGFRVRGMGFSASIQTASPAAVTEAFDAATVAANAATVTTGNGLLEPNECNSLNIPVSNNGPNPATGISAVLSSTTPGITVTQANSAYPDIPAGGGPVANTTPYQVSVDNTVACFTTANFTLTLTFTGGGGGSPIVSNFSLPVGQPGTNYIFSTGTGAAIPAGGTVVAGSTADDAQVSIPLPSGWASTLYGVPVTSLSASTNGMVTANGAAATTFTNTALPAAVGGTNPTLFPAWDDYDMDPADTTGGGIYINTVGSAPNREFWIEWRATHFSEATTAISNHFAVKLTEGSGTVQYVHVLTGVAPNNNGASATVGIQRASAPGSPFTQAGFNAVGTITPGMIRTGTLPGGICTPGPGGCLTTIRSRADFDGDGRSDVSVYRPSEGNWYLNRSTAGFAVLKWGLATDTLVPGDYDNDNKTDTAIFRPVADGSQPDFYILNSGGGATFTTFGQAGDVPVAGNFGGTAAADRTVYRSGTWISQLSGGGSLNVALGAAGDVLVPADYSGDNVDDIAVFRPSTGGWHVRNSTGGAVTVTAWGTSGDIPVPGDYDGDGSDDLAIYRNGTWWLLRSTAGAQVQPFGLSTDKAIPRSYVP